MTTQLVTIGSTQIPVVMYQDQPVVTFAMIDKVHQRPEGTASRTFGSKRERFTEGKHFYLVDFSKNNVLRPFGVEVPPRGLTLITERGYLKLVKTLDDDLAWDVQDQLIDGYFRAQEKTLSPAEQLLRSAQQLVAHERRLQMTEQRQDKLEVAVAEIKATLPSAHTHSTVKAYAISREIMINKVVALKLGRRCALRCKSVGLPLLKISDDQYGVVNAYPLEILQQVFDEEMAILMDDLPGRVPSAH
jgi:hypothetical protein